jgi:hypothetical protein
MLNNRGSIIEEDRQLQERKLGEHRRDYTDPIKHFIRRSCWLPAAQERLRKNINTNRTHLRYFTMCAGNAIDIWFFYRIENLLFYDGRGFPNVVFCERLPDEYEKIVRSLGRTNGYYASFEDLILQQKNEDSIDFFSRIPFDVYNLDFSGVCFPKREPPFSSTLEAIVTLIEKLGRPEYQPGFDMFFTFRAQKTEENRIAIKYLFRNLRDNRNSHPRFNELIAQRYGDELEGLRDCYHAFLLISLPKYLGRIGKENGFSVSMTYRYYYSRPNRNNPKYQIISFGLCFDWIGRDGQIIRGVRQPVPRREITTEAYLEMMMQLVRDDIPIVATTKAIDEDNGNQVRQLLKEIELR